MSGLLAVDNLAKSKIEREVERGIVNDRSQPGNLHYRQIIFYQFLRQAIRYGHIVDEFVKSAIDEQEPEQGQLSYQEKTRNVAAIDS